jgi:hypothetical protein
MKKPETGLGTPGREDFAKVMNCVIVLSFQQPEAAMPAIVFLAFVVTIVTTPMVLPLSPEALLGHFFGTTASITAVIMGAIAVHSELFTEPRRR